MVQLALVWRVRRASPRERHTVDFSIGGFSLFAASAQELQRLFIIALSAAAAQRTIEDEREVISPFIAVLLRNKYLRALSTTARSGLHETRLNVRGSLPPRQARPNRYLYQYIFRRFSIYRKT